jgi:hypothetical protein
MSLIHRDNSVPEVVITITRQIDGGAQAAAAHRGNSPNSAIVIAASTHTAGSCTNAAPISRGTWPPTSPTAAP